MGDAGLSHLLKRWRRARQVARCRVVDAALDLHERYGPAAAIIAGNSARQRGGREHRKFWRNVARELSRHPPRAEAF